MEEADESSDEGSEALSDPGSSSESDGEDGTNASYSSRLSFTLLSTEVLRHPEQRQTVQKRDKQRMFSGGPKLVALRAVRDGEQRSGPNASATFGQRRTQRPVSISRNSSKSGGVTDGPVDFSWTPEPSRGGRKQREDADGTGKRKKRLGVETFGAGMERGGHQPDQRAKDEAERHGRTKRRTGMRSGSRNVFRRL